MVIVIPEPDHWPGQIVLITERAEARRTQQKIFAPSSRAQSQPAGGQHANEVSARKQQYIPFDAADSLDDAIRAFADLFGSFPARRAISKQLPVWALTEDLRRGQAFVFAIVPFHQVGIGHGASSKSRQCAGSGCALQWAGENLGELHTLEPLPKPLRITLAIGGQGQIGKAGVLAGESPCSVPVPRYIHYWEYFAHAVLCSSWILCTRSSTCRPAESRLHARLPTFR